MIHTYLRDANCKSSSDFVPVTTILPKGKISAVVLGSQICICCDGCEMLCDDERSLTNQSTQFSFLYTLQILYGFNQFIGHTSQRVPDVPKFSPCHASQRGPDKRSECDIDVTLDEMARKAAALDKFLLLSWTLQAGWQKTNFVGHVTVAVGCRFDWNHTVPLFPTFDTPCNLL